VLLERRLGLGGAAINKARGHEQRLGSFFIGAALAAAAHQEGGGAQFSGQLGRQDRLRHWRLSNREALRRPGGLERATKNPGPLRARALSTVPDLLARYFTWSRKPVGSNHHEHSFLSAGRRQVKPMIARSQRNGLADPSPIGELLRPAPVDDAERAGM